MRHPSPFDLATITKSLALAVLLAFPVAVAAGPTASCLGDCDGDGSVTVDEIITLVSIALGERELLDCMGSDADGSGAIEVDEIIRAVNHALDGCPDPQPQPYKTQVDHPFDPYLAFSATDGGPSWVKFTIRTAEPHIVYFQNSNQTPFHHDFVTASLEPYIGWSHAEIDAVSLYAEGQELVFGAVLYSPRTPHEIAIQLVRQDAYSIAEVIAYFGAVRSAVRANPSVPFFYFPTFEQQQSAEAQRDALDAAGIPLGSTARWLDGDACYSFGWAHGRLVFVPGDQIDAAYAAGTLRPDDILLTDGVPAAIPFVAGILSLRPSTPNSHVAILAADWDIPFAFLAQPDSVAAAEALVGRDVVLRATTLTPQIFTGSYLDFEHCQLRLVDVTDALDEDLAAHLRDLKRAPDLQIRPFQLAGSYSREVIDATPDDIVTIGGKAANYGFLLRSIPANTRPAMAFTFDLWNEYLDQTIDGDTTLRQRIAELLAPFPTYPPASFAALYDALDEIRDLIDDVADFTPAQRSAIIAALDRFDPMQRIRFRSSTNVEDSDVFTGAGLYNSESGCLADDLDDDTVGPSHCDATRPGERGVFRALRKVFESFYYDNAFLERLRHGVDESTVGMAVLVHYTFIDETELGNGVATLRVAGPTSAQATIVMQPGALSVTNPEDDGLPEVVDVFAFGSSVFPTLRQATDRLPLGATVLDMPAEYITLTNLLRTAGQAFASHYGESRYDIEFEFKKIVGEGLVIRQVRRIPALTSGGESDPVLIAAPLSLCTFQGEYGDVFANYRLKSRWQPQLASRVIGDGGDPFLAAPHRFVHDGALMELGGHPSTWPDARHESFDPQIDGVLGVRDHWTIGAGASRRSMVLSTLVPTGIGPRRLPIVFPSDLGFTLEVAYATPVPFVDFEGTVAGRTEDVVLLVPCSDERPLTAGHLFQQRTPTRDGLGASIGFYWPPPPSGAVAGYTAPLDRWTATTITGIGTEPTSLEGYFSQTYRPEHHNFTEGFLFDPFLEEGIEPSVLAPWEAAGIRALYIPPSFEGPSFQALTFAGELVPISAVPAAGAHP